MAEDARRLAEKIGALERRMAVVERTSQLAYSSVEGGSTDVYDDDGNLRGRWGEQDDGTYTSVDYNAPPSLPPSTPTLTPRPGLLVVGWDGLLSDGSTPPLDFARVEVHVGTAPGFAPTDANQVTTFVSRKGGEVAIASDPGTYYVVLTAVNTSGNESAPSVEVSGSPQPAATGAGGIKTYYAATAPVGLDASDEGSLWYDTDNDNLQHRWDGTTWVALPVGTGALLDGSVTETKVADDAITTPKIAAGSVTALELAANAVEAGKIASGAVTADKIAAQAVTADKLESDLVLGSRIISGTATGARVEMNSAGLVAYNSLGESTFTVDSASGDVTMVGLFKTDITDTRVEIGKVTAAPDPYDTIAQIEFEAGDQYGYGPAIVSRGTGTGGQSVLEIDSGSLVGYDRANIMLRSQNDVGGGIPPQIDFKADTYNLYDAAGGNNADIWLRGTVNITETSGASGGGYDAPITIGDVTGRRLCLDSNELVAYADSLNSPATLFLNSNSGNTGGVRIGSGGKTINAIDYGYASVNCDSNGNADVSHGLGRDPHVVLVSPGIESAMVGVRGLTASKFTIGVNNANGASHTGSLDLYYIAIG